MQWKTADGCELLCIIGIGLWHAGSRNLLQPRGVQPMRRVPLLTIATVISAAVFVAAPAEAKQCFKKAAIGDALTQDLAKFQVDAMLLQSTDFSIYLTYVASGTTPGYSFGKRSYHCAPGAVGWECRGSATLCKL
jgi:hypothetical protein